MLALAATDAGAQGVPPPAANQPFGLATTPDPDQGLRGTAPFGGDTLGASPVEPVGPLEPVAPEGPEDVPGRPARIAAGQGSALRAPRAGSPRLPALAPYPTSQRPTGAAIDTLDRTSINPTSVPGPTDPALSPAVAALPVPSPVLRRPVDATPFAPLGYTFGVLRLFPYVEESLGYDSNPDQTTGGKGSAFSRTEGGFSLLSLWSSNALTADMRGGYDAFFQNPDANRPDGTGRVDYRYDVSRELTLDSEARFAVSTQRPGSPELDVAVQSRPLIASYGATIGGTETLGRLSLGLHGLLDRTTYEDARLGSGTVIPLSTQDFTDYAIAVRADYELSPTLRPFAEITLDTRVHDDAVDYTGYQRDSDGILGRLGTSFELTPLITGVVSAGYENRTYADKRLRDLRGPVVDASVVYAITPLTTLTLLATTSFNETNVVGSPGAESRSVSFTVSHALLRNLTLTGTLAYLNTDYIASPITENTYAATLKADYNVNRWLVLEASYNHQTLHSSVAGSSFDQDVFLMGLRLQP